MNASFSSTERQSSFSRSNRQHALEVEGLRQQAAGDYERHRNEAAKIDQILADPKNKLSYQERLQFNLFSFLIKILPSENEPIPEHVQLLLRSVLETIAKTVLKKEKQEMGSLAAEVKQYVEFILDPGYPERLNEVLEKAWDEAEHVRKVAQEICL